MLPKCLLVPLPCRAFPIKYNSGRAFERQDTEADPARPGAMGSKQIAQETFDEAVQENITEFEMEPEEAVREAVLQFESQGVDLSNIVKAVRPPASENGQRQKHQILLTLESLARAVAEQDVAQLPQQLLSLARMAASALRVMTFDDDIRVPFGHAHDHAKMIVLENDGLRVLIEAAKAFTDNSGVLSELCATLSRLSVRNEFCQDIVDLGGLNFMVTLLADCMEHPDVVKQVLSAIRAVAGNDGVKDAIVDAGATELIVLAISHHLGNPQICEQGCAALCMLALRKPENCSVIMEGGGALAALQAMKAHPREVAVQKQACMLIRNLVSRSREL
ncbi:armadillo repeat-containing protein 6 [Geospiza fortis]|uniref:Armadillo repeat-containing protein 6 n=1 Tax=Geospiza fortis TaxID=48883 RepID=A0A8N5F5S6_GEOFO|nr:armadillo repeat-containing protein 6 [Geospiza fortis]